MTGLCKIMHKSAEQPQNLSESVQKLSESANTLAQAFLGLDSVIRSGFVGTPEDDPSIIVGHARRVETDKSRILHD